MFAKTPEVRASHADRDRAVERLRIASGEGRLGAEELDARLEVALTATTRSELDAVVADLPAVPGADQELVIQQRGGRWERTGTWVVPERIRIKTRMTKIVLDFRDAVISSPVVTIDGTVKHGKLVIITGPNVTIDAGAAVLDYSKVKVRSESKAPQPRLVVRFVGKLKHAKLVEKPVK